jgi:hypothetical protein
LGNLSFTHRYIRLQTGGFHMPTEVFGGNYLKVILKRYGEKYYEAVDAPDAAAIVAIHDRKDNFGRSVQACLE